MINSYQKPEDHDVIIVGSGPGGLGVAATLEGWHPYLSDTLNFKFGPNVDNLIRSQSDLLQFKPSELLDHNVRPIDFFRNYHHPKDYSLNPDEYKIKFSKTKSLDWLMITSGQPGGLWNGVPRNQLTLGPSYWMELAHYPMKQFFFDFDLDRDPNELGHRDDLILYYKKFVERFNLHHKIRGGEKLVHVDTGDNERRFKLIVDTNSSQKIYECDYLVFAVGPKSQPRKLQWQDESNTFISNNYTYPGDYPRDSCVIVGGGRSSDWAATELYDAKKLVVYVMRQAKENHLRLIKDSLHLPYYQRLNVIVNSQSNRFKIMYDSEIKRLTNDGNVTVVDNKSQITSEIITDHLIVEIGASANYQLLSKWFPLTLTPKRDNYRFQLMQMACNQSTFESVDIPGLYPAGYLAEGTGLSVIGFHAGSYLIAGDIYRKINKFSNGE